ncbi:MAG: PAS domain-containing protein [Pirellulaceae bacterium]
MKLDYYSRLIPRRSWIAIALCAMAMSYVPLLTWVNEPSTILLPLVISSICFMLTMRHGLLLVIASQVLTLTSWLAVSLVWRDVLVVEPAGSTEVSSGTTTRTAIFLGLALAQLSVGLAQILVVRSPWGPGRARRRLASRVRRQTARLQAIASTERTSAQRFESDRRALLEHLPVHIVQKDREGRFTFVTQSFCDLVRRDYDDIIGRTDADLFPTEAAHKFMDDDQRVMKLATVFDDIEQTQLPDGTHSYMQVRKAPLRDDANEIVGVQGIFWDVTEEHTGRQELQRIEALAHALIHAALDAVLIVDPEGRILEANPASETILGYTRDQIAMHPPLGSIMQTTLEEVGERATDDAQEVNYFERKVPIAKVLTSATGKRIEARMRRHDGAWFDAEVSTHPLSIEGSEGWAMFVRDITRRKKSETELRSAKELAERANAAKSEFVANVSHELRTPLTGIIGLHELLQRSNTDTRQQNYIQLAQVSAGNLLNLIDDLLDFSKIEAGCVELESTQFSVVDCVEEAAASIAARAQLKGLELLVDLPNDLPQVCIGDSHRIKQVLLNLLGNAIKFTEVGDIRVRVRCLDDSSLSNSDNVCVLRFEVHDHGIGVPVEQRKIIFDSFRQADSSTTRRYGGTGLGLTICRDLVKMMQGTIAVEDSNLGSRSADLPLGSCFYFELPLEVHAATETIDPLSEPATRREEVVLVASPSPWRELLQRQLEELGFRLTLLTIDDLSKRRPARLFAAGNQSIIIADYKELCLQSLPTIPVVVRWVLLSPLASPQPTVIPDWLKYADVHWLARPVRRQQLATALAADAPALAPTDPPPVAHAAHVLLVEDSPVSQTVLQDMLQSLGHHVELASNGNEAIAACARTRFDLVLMDIQMPEVDGLAATEQIRSRETGTGWRQPIIALTAHATAADRELCENSGMDGFLVKPIKLDELQQAVETIMISQGQSVGSSAISQSDVSQDTRAMTPEVETQDEAQEATVCPVQDWLSDAPEWPQLLQLMGGNEKLLLDVLQLIVREIPKLSRNFEKAVERRDTKEACRAVHTLKSNVRHVGLNRLSAYAERLEHQARDERQTQLERATAPLREIASAVADWAEATLAMHKS